MTASDKKALTATLEMIVELIKSNPNLAIKLIRLYIDELKG